MSANRDQLSKELECLKRNLEAAKTLLSMPSFYKMTSPERVEKVRESLKVFETKISEVENTLGHTSGRTPKIF